MIIVGILLEVCAAGLGTTSKQLIAYSEHTKKRWIFHVGASINILVGPVVDASAYAFAPQVVVAPFACLDVIFNALTAPYTLRWQNEKLTRAHIIGTCLVTLGAALTSVFGSVTDRAMTVYELEEQLLLPASLCYMATELVAILTMHLCLKAKLLSATTRGIALGVIAGILMGNVFFLKGFMGIIHNTFSEGETEAWLRPTPYICIIAAASGAVLGHIFMRKGLGEYKGIFMVTIFEGAHITAACLSGCVVMQEMAHAPWWRYSFYWASVLTLVAGMLFINTAAKDATIEKAKDGEESKWIKAEPHHFHIAQSFAEGDEEAAVASPAIGKSIESTDSSTEMRSEVELSSDLSNRSDSPMQHLDIENVEINSILNTKGTSKQAETASQNKLRVSAGKVWRKFAKHRSMRDMGSKGRIGMKGKSVRTLREL
mmetsp:Transcript_66827/g.145754  ORF Transcript_66827/g.145754 Transcript_66827/m.145754 type:complete len:429 (+) Transcript_66827:80-1366(+)